MARKRCHSWLFCHISLCLPLILVLSPFSIAILGLYLTFFSDTVSFETEAYANTLLTLQWSPPINRYAHLLANKAPLDEQPLA